MDDRLKKFEYLVSKLLTWYKEEQKIEDKELYNNNDFSKLKVLKLLFFLCAIKPDLLKDFTDFYALPYGPVEMEVYNNLTTLPHFNIDSSKTTLRSDYKETTTYSDCDKAIEYLKERNPEIISYTPFQLVNLSHEWSCWINAFKIAYDSGRLKEKITSDAIENDIKNYRL